MSQPTTHFVNLATVPADRGRCSYCLVKLERGDDWTVTTRYVTCEGAEVDTFERKY
jgi:hypothetical protein